MIHEDGFEKNQDSIQNVIYKRSKMREPLFSTQKNKHLIYL